MRKLRESILFLYFFVLFMVYPFYFQEGYIQIGQAKYEFFKWMGIVLLAALIPLSVYLKDFSMSYADYIFVGYLLINILSFCVSPYKSNAFFGTSGWNLGLFTQFLFVFLLFASGQWQGFMLWGLPVFVWMACGGAAGVFVLGILNRFSVYPIPMARFNPDFISTLGSINWYSGYWSVLAPLGWGAYAAAERKKELRCIVVHICLGVFGFLAVLTGVTVGSSSVYLVFAICMIVFVWKSFDDRKWLLSFLELLVIAALALQAVRVLHAVFPAGMQYDSSLIHYLMIQPVGWYLLLVAVLLYLTVLFWVPDYGNVKCLHEIRAYLFALLVAVAVCIGVVFVLNTVVPGGIWPVRGIDFFYFSDMWGNGRGGIWKDTMMAFARMTNVQKLFGVGPDSYVCFLYDFPEIARRLVNQFGSARLTNAHNEFLNLLVNVGIFGVVFYVGAFVAALMTFFRKMDENPILFAVILGILGYLLHNMVSFSHVLNTPYVFVMIGLGQGLTKQVDSPKVVNRSAFGTTRE